LSTTHKPETKGALLPTDGIARLCFYGSARKSEKLVDLLDFRVAAATTTYQIRSYRISRLSVRQMGTAAIVNFFYEQHASYAGKDLSGDFFLVDLWQKAGNAWKLVARVGGRRAK
jgi:hypothetical protein